MSVIQALLGEPEEGKLGVMLDLWEDIAAETACGETRTVFNTLQGRVGTAYSADGSDPEGWIASEEARAYAEIERVMPFASRGYHVSGRIWLYATIIPGQVAPADIICNAEAVP